MILTGALASSEIEGLVRFGQASPMKRFKGHFGKKAVTDGGWVDANDLGSEALVIAKQSMETGRYVEYSCCYETTGVPAMT